LEHPADFFESQGSHGNFVGKKPTILNTRVQHTDKTIGGFAKFQRAIANYSAAKVAEFGWRQT